MTELINQIKELQTRVEEAWAALRLEERAERLVGQQAAMPSPDFWQDRAAAERISRQLAKEETAIYGWKGLQDDLQDLLVLAPDHKSGPAGQFTA